MSENGLHLTVADYLNIALPRDCVWHHSPNEGLGTVAWYKKRAALGTRAGWPDIEIWWRGKAYAIELKWGKNKLSDNQKYCRDDILLAGCPFALCYDLDEVIAALVLWGLVKGETNVTGIVPRDKR